MKKILIIFSVVVLIMFFSVYLLVIITEVTESKDRFYYECVLKSTQDRCSYLITKDCDKGSVTRCIKQQNQFKLCTMTDRNEWCNNRALEIYK